MTITIYERNDLKGGKKTVTSSIADLKGVCDKPSSIRMTSSRDAILMFKSDDWKGGTLYLRGPKTINNLGSSKQGGRHTYGNSIRSVRTSPFRLDLNITVVETTKGDLPGNWTNELTVEREIRQIVKLANDFYKDQRAMLELRISGVPVFRTSNSRFITRRSTTYPRSWKKRGLVDIVFSDQFKGGSTVGRAPSPCGGQVIRLACRDTKGVQLTINERANIMVHEIGHYLGLSHRTAGSGPKNIMAADGLYPIMDTFFTQDQIREMHLRLARNISRKGDRN